MGTYTTAYKSGTFNGTPTGTTITVTGATPASGDIGRYMIVKDGSAILQIREITAFSGQTYTLQHAFNASAFTGVTEVTPASGDAWVLTYDMDDLIASDGDLVVTGNNNLAIAALVMKTDAYILARNYDIEFNSSNIECWINAGLILGTYGYVAGEDAYALNSCNVTDTVSGTAGEQMAGRNGNNNPSIGSFHMYGGDVYIPNSCFWRLYQGSTSAGTACCSRFIDVRFNGLMGGRLEGDLSIVIASGALSTSIFGLFNFLEIARIQLSIFDSSQALYIHRSIAPTGRSTLTRLVGITSWVVYSTGSDTGATVYEIIGKKSEIDAVPSFIHNTVVDADHIYRYGNMIKPTFIDATGELLVTDIKTVLFDTGDNTINTETVTSGNYTPLFARHTDIVTPVIQDYDIADGTLYAPYELNSFAFGYQIASSTISLEDTYENAVLFLAETTLTETVKATIDAYTTLDDAFEVYDRAYSYLYGVYAGESQVLINRIGTQLDFNSGSATALVVDSTASVIGYTGTTLTVKSTTFTGGVTGTGTVTIQSATALNGGTFNCDVNYSSSATTLTDVTCTGTFDFDTAGTYTLNGCTINEVTNSSGGAVILNLTNGSTVTTNTGPSITVNTIRDISITGITAGSRLQIYNVTTAAEVYNGVVAGTSYVSTYNEADSITVGDTVRVRLTWQSGTSAKLCYTTNVVAGSTGWSALADQQDDTVYNGYAVDGSLVTGFAADYVNDEVDITIAADFTAKDLYAWWMYNMTTAQGISDFCGGITAVDAANININNATVDIYIDNTTATNLKQTDNIRIYRDDAAYPVKSSGGGGVDIVWRNQIYVTAANPDDLADAVWNDTSSRPNGSKGQRLDELPRIVARKEEL